ncbi:hypothetical protein LXA43DRAFT_974968 [Ganoderma leucocontextum]|nr:hypothetical protein LXA43DRAFT_974968 [Ganoderma leucocontextum]
MPLPNSGDYVASWLDALSDQGTGWLPEVYSDPPRPSHYSTGTRAFVDHSFDPFSPSFHQESRTMHHYPSHLGVTSRHSNSPVNPLYRHNVYTPIVSHRLPSPVFYEEHSPPLPIIHSFPDFGFGDTDSLPWISSSSSATDTESVSASESRRRQKSKIALAADQPLTVDGKPRERVYVACNRCSAASALRTRACFAAMRLPRGGEGRTRRPAFGLRLDRGSRAGPRHARSAPHAVHEMASPV